MPIRSTISILLDAGITKLGGCFKRPATKLERTFFYLKLAFILVFTAGVIHCQSYILILLIGLIIACLYTPFALASYVSDTTSPRRAPRTRLHYLFFAPAGECLICQDNLQNPVLLSCGRLYCAAYIEPSLDKKVNHCAHCFQ